jgi:hypothetical protein
VQQVIIYCSAPAFDGSETPEDFLILKGRWSYGCVFRMLVIASHTFVVRVRCVCMNVFPREENTCVSNVRMCKHMRVCIHAFRHTRVCVCVCVYLCVLVCMCTYVCMCMCSYVCTCM